MIVQPAEIVRFEGNVTSPRGFRAAGIHCGIKTSRKDLALIVSDTPASAAAMFTTNAVKAAPVLVSQERIQSGAAQAVIINSGNANACTGTQGLADAAEMTHLASEALGVAGELVLVASTGIIGVPLPMPAIRGGIPRAAAALSTKGGANAAEAILTTDAFPKTAAARLEIAGRPVTIAGMAKGAGMIHPNLATTLCILTTDAAVAPDPLRSALRDAVDRSFNCISVDGDTSTNDTVCCLANGAAGHPAIVAAGEDLNRFARALTLVATDLARMVVRDGEGATKVVTLRVRGARSNTDAKIAATAVMTSPLVKTALFGGEPNWGRVVAAVGRSGAAVDPDRVDVWMAGHQLVRCGTAASPDVAAASEAMRAPEYEIVVDLHLGSGAFTGWMSDLTDGYVRINAGYMT